MTPQQHMMTHFLLVCLTWYFLRHVKVFTIISQTETLFTWCVHDTSWLTCWLWSREQTCCFHSVWMDPTETHTHTRFASESQHANDSRLLFYSWIHVCICSNFLLINDMINWWSAAVGWSAGTELTWINTSEVCLELADPSWTTDFTQHVHI